MGTNQEIQVEEFVLGYIHPAGLFTGDARRIKRADIAKGEKLTVSVRKASPSSATLAFEVTEPEIFDHGGGKREAWVKITKVMSLEDRFWVQDASGPGEYPTLDREAVLWHLRRIAGVTVVKGMAIVNSERVEEARAAAGRILMLGEEVYREYGVPVWFIDRKGAGANVGGGTELVVDWMRDGVGPGSMNLVFQADDLEAAIATATKVAVGRGDFKSIPIKPRGEIKHFIELPERVREQAYQIEQAWRTKVEDLVANDPLVAAKELELVEAEARQRTVKTERDRLRSLKKAEVDTPENRANFGFVVSGREV